MNSDSILCRKDPLADTTTTTSLSLTTSKYVLSTGRQSLYTKNVFFRPLTRGRDRMYLGTWGLQNREGKRFFGRRKARLASRRCLWSLERVRDDSVCHPSNHD